MLRTRAMLVLVGLAISATAGPALAGPLSPPAGSIAPTYKTLGEVEPRKTIDAANTPGDADSVFRITTPGTYYMTGEILVPPGKRGIEIATDDVTLDMNGFRIGGFAGTLEGIAVVSSIDRANITVRNGLINNMQSTGIQLTPVGGTESHNCRVEDVRVWNCTGGGISVSTSSVVRNCQVSRCGNPGISAGFSCLIEGCTAGDGTGTGIYAANNSVITRCTSLSNAGSGFQLAYRATIRESAATLNQTGIVALSDSLITDCVSSENTLDGIFSGGEGGLITRCNVSLNGRHGISVYGKCTVRQNNCFVNSFANGTGANIYISGSQNRIEENNCTNADFGIQATGAANIIIRNTCSSNTTNWSIAANNVVGAIVDRTSPGSAAINGNSAPDSSGTSNPNANFTY